jgi:hypothetical protein
VPCCWPGYGLELASDAANGVDTLAMSWNDAAFQTYPGFLRALLHAALG